MSARLETALRECEGCGTRFGRRRFPSGQLERASQFAERRFCSRACYRKAAADGLRVRVPGEWIVRPYALKSTEAILTAPENPAPARLRNAALNVAQTRAAARRGPSRSKRNPNLNQETP